jgi:dolichol kinase
MMNGWKRRLFHLCSISLLIVIVLLIPKDIALILLGGIAAVLVSLEFLRLIISQRLNLWVTSLVSVLMREREMSQPWTSTYVVIAVLLVLGLFEKEVAALSMCFLAVGDPAASMIGERFGRHRLWGKSLEGAAACFISCLIVGLLLTAMVFTISIPVVVAGSFCAALVEFLPLRLNDNFTVPVVASIVMTILL